MTYQANLPIWMPVVFPDRWTLSVDHDEITIVEDLEGQPEEVIARTFDIAKCQHGASVSRDGTSLTLHLSGPQAMLMVLNEVAAQCVARELLYIGTFLDLAKDLNRPRVFRTGPVTLIGHQSKGELAKPQSDEGPK